MNFAYSISDKGSQNKNTTFISCEINTSLLAKSRVVNTPKGEQNYLIFYPLFSDETATVKILEDLGIAVQG